VAKKCKSFKKGGDVLQMLDGEKIIDGVGEKSELLQKLLMLSSNNNTRVY